LGAGAPAVHGVAGGTHDALKVVGLTAGAFHFGVVVVTHNKQFKEIFTFQAFEFEYRHMELLKYFINGLFSVSLLRRYYQGCQEKETKNFQAIHVHAPVWLR
jgi:hypothetical protein